MLYYWQINNNYEDDSVFLDHTGLLNEDAIRKAIIESQVSTVLYSKDIPNDTIISLKKSIPEVIFKRSYDPRIYVRSLREECYEVQNPVLNLSGKVTEEFYAKKQKLKNDSVSAEKIAETTMLHPGKRILWSCCNPSSVMVDFFEEITFKKPITYLECCTQFGETFRYVCNRLPKGSSLYGVDFWQKVKGFPMSDEAERDYKIHRIGFKGDLGYNEAMEKLVQSNPDLHFDLAFYDANHKSRDDRALRAIAKVSDIVIVHDANFEEVTTMCRGIFGDKPFKLHGNELTEAYSRIYILNKSDKWQLR